MKNNDIAWDIRFGLPNPEYIEYASRFLLYNENLRVDPFGLAISDDKIKSAYVRRQGLDNRISPYKRRIILGPPGSGKTAFVHWQGLEISSKRLVVNLELNPVIKDKSLGNNGVVANILKSNLLTAHIFNTYWTQILLDDYNRGQFLESLRRNKEWMQMLRWFYHQYPPMYPQITEEFELMAWLSLPPENPFGANISDESVLYELVKFVTKEIGSLKCLYNNVHVFIDNTAILSGPETHQLLRDFERLHNLTIPNLYVDLLLNSAWEKAVYELECVKKEHIALYNVPKWTLDNLRKLLDKRLEAWLGELILEENWEWTDRLPDLSDTARRHCVDKILKEALCISEEHIMDAPVHALKLTRGLVAACAGCWPQQFQSPLTNKGIDILIEIYRQAILEEEK